MKSYNRRYYVYSGSGSDFVDPGRPSWIEYDGECFLVVYPDGRTRPSGFILNEVKELLQERIWREITKEELALIF